MRHLLLLGLLAVDLLQFAESFILPPGYVTPLFPNLPVPFLPTLGVIQASGLMPLLVSTLHALQAATIIALFATGGYRRKRSSSPEGLVNPESLLIAVSRLDTHGCVLKLLCQLEAESPDALSVEERILVAAFADRLELFAKGSGVEEAIGGDGQACEASGDKCPFEGALLRGLLSRVWRSHSV
ncbi:uncharacterized protein LOC119588844 [Penaeus monodon]|uniref:uncharacterized protein LOC119588844 n=1 Tax=Penaeus monodon TaxID=6687 RepID=UPI0018A73507|nr:uncharacterized protein LOC119588844 [Penaeus monodon]